ncbi:MAG: ELWxxDGT repeat protein [Planctomycetaceae bacterium]
MAGFLKHVLNLLQDSRKANRRSGLSLRDIQSLEKRSLLAADFQIVKDINPSLTPDSSSPENFIAIGSIVYFAATTDSGSALWRVNGTAGVPVIVKTFGENFSSRPQNLTNVSGVLYFTVNDGTNGVELWKSDGTEAGTVMVKDIRGSGSSSPSQLTNLNGTLFFAADDGANGVELWKSNGTSTGTVLVKDLHPGTHQQYQYGFYGSGYLATVPNSSAPTSLINVGGTLYFAATDETSGRELWRSDGTAAGTVLVKDIFTGTYDTYQQLGAFGSYPVTIPNSSDPKELTNVGGTLYFTAKDGSTGNELWKTDGTSVGTSLVKDIFAGTSGSSPSYLINVQGSLYFAASESTTGRELWKSSGTEAGTAMVSDIAAGNVSSTPRKTTNVEGLIYFSANDGSSGTELWRTDGTGTGTVLVKDAPWEVTARHLSG